MSSDALIDKVLNYINENEVKFIDLRFTDSLGKEQHVTIPASAADKAFFQHGKMFDGSSIKGWQKIHQSDLSLMPDLNTAVPDPFFEDVTLIIRCNIVEPTTMENYERDPRSLALRAEEYLQQSGIAEVCNVGPEPEFFIFDDVRWTVDMQGASYHVDSREAAWNSGRTYDEGNYGHRPQIKGGYFPVPPVDSAQEMRATMSITLEDMGVPVEAHHHEVATSNQNEVATRYNSLTKKADEVQILKYVVHNVAHMYEKSATFMPKPVVGDNGSGMHCHFSLFKDGENLFHGNEYAGLSETALFFIGGIIKHAKALNVFTNPATNSYKRLVPGFEAPVLLAYSARNRSAAIRIPYVTSSKAQRVEVRFPDAMANPYLAFSALLMAGIDGIKNKIHPGDPIDKDLYDLPEQELAQIDMVCVSLEQAILALREDHDFLLQGGVFNQGLIESYIQLKKEEIQRLRMATHPVEFDMYYSA